MITELRNMEDLKLVEDIKKYVDDSFGTVDKSRMLSRLVDNEELDPWMTFELMEAALRNLATLEGVVLKENMCRNRASSTTAAPEHLNLEGSEADKYYNFQSIRVDGAKGKATIRHQNRPDGMFNLKLGQDNEMVIFYEGDAHDRDVGKNETKGCKNAHKMYQYMIQAQSLNKRSSGCAVFAAMKDAPTDQVGEFIEDMFKAHMFAGMLIIQHNMYQRKTARTILEDLLELDTKKKYDFVIGINIKSLPTNEAFSTDNFDGRVCNLLAALKKTDVKVELDFDDPTQKALPTYDCTVGCLNITCFAVPRAPENLLTRAYVEPPFVYPMHLSHVTTWFGDNGTMNTRLTNGNSVVNVRINPGNANMDLKFKKNMMKITYVDTRPNAVASKNTCLLKDTDGFFYLALPLAYFTIEQFECLVNRRLDYRWAPKRYDVKKMVYELMVSIKGVSILPVRVEMFKEDENSLLQQICRSTDKKNPKITDEFQGFLKDCCKWEKCSAYAYPAIFFRTLGIFTLPNAIDFACEVKNNQSATYTTLLSTYPVGTQIVIKQCMKKLSTNEAYGYLRREKIAVKTDTLIEQGPSDEDDEPPPPPGIVGAIQALFASTKTSWDVTHRNSTDADYQTWSEMQKKQAGRGKRILPEELMKKYKKSVESWRVKKEKFDGVDEQKLDRDDNNILLIAEDTHHIDFNDPNATLKASGMDFGGKTYKYKTQLRGEIYSDDDDDEWVLYCKPIWPHKMDLDILRTRHQQVLKDRHKIYAIFDKETILRFEYRDTSLLASILSPEKQDQHQPKGSKTSPRRVQFAGVPTQVSLDTPPLSDTNDVYL